MFTRHIAHITHVHDATMMSNHANSDGVFTHLRCYVFVHLDAQIFQHQQTWADAEVCQFDPWPAGGALVSFKPLQRLQQVQVAQVCIQLCLVCSIKENKAFSSKCSHSNL